MAAWLMPVIGSIASSIVSSVFGSAEERAKRKTLKEEQKNLGQKYEIEESKLTAILAQRRLNILHTLVVVIGAIPFVLALFDAITGSEHTLFILNAIQDRVPQAYIEGYLYIVAALFGIRVASKWTIKR